MPLDLDEARELLGFQGRIGRAAEAALEDLHRDVLGNPARLLRLAGSRTWTGSSTAGPAPGLGRRESTQSARDGSGSELRPAEKPAEGIPPSGNAAPPETAGPARSPSLIPTRPPIRLEDGLVEVGWEGELEAEVPHAAGSAPQPPVPSQVGSPPNDEMVEDRYAALQAWTEWARNRESSADTGPPPGQTDPPTGEPAVRETPVDDEPPVDSERSTASPVGNIRAESPHEFAPYSQLFTRLRQSRGA
jgi:general secretion pathway protein A